MADNTESEATDMKERILKLMEHEQMGQTQFANKTGIQRGAMSHLISGRNKPSLDVMTKILRCYPQIHPDWLLFGKGEMLREAAPGAESPEDTPKNPPRMQVIPDDCQEHSSPESRKENGKPEKSWPIPAEKSSKTVSKIMVFYSDNTYDTFVPKRTEGG